MGTLPNDYEAYMRIKRDWDDLVEARKIALESAYEKIRSRISAGESTGDRILDFCIAKFGSEDLTVPFLRDLESRMTGKIGEPILLIERKTPIGSSPLESSIMRFHYEWSFLACILEEETLVLDNESFGFSCKRHADWVGRFAQGDGIKVVRGDLYPPYGVLYMTHLLPDQEQNHFILVGQEEIAERLPKLLAGEQLLEAHTLENALNALLASLKQHEESPDRG